MPGPDFTIYGDMGVRLTNLRQNLNQARAEAAVAAQQMDQEGEGIGKSWFGGALKQLHSVHTAFRAFALIFAAELVSGIGLGALKIAKGNIAEGLEELEKIPFFGRMVSLGHELHDEFTGAREEAERIKTNFEAIEKSAEAAGKIRGITAGAIETLAKMKEDMEFSRDTRGLSGAALEDARAKHQAKADADRIEALKDRALKEINEAWMDAAIAKQGLTVGGKSINSVASLNAALDTDAVRQFLERRTSLNMELAEARNRRDSGALGLSGDRTIEDIQTELALLGLTFKEIIPLITAREGLAGQTNAAKRAITDTVSQLLDSLGMKETDDDRKRGIADSISTALGTFKVASNAEAPTKSEQQKTNTKLDTLIALARQSGTKIVGFS